MADNPLQIYPYHVNLIQKLAKTIIEENQNHLPFLHNTVILVPNYQTTFLLQESIGAVAANYGHATIVGLKIFTLKDYIHSSNLCQHQTIDTIARELLLFNELKNHHSLFGKHNTLTTTSALLELFDELTQFQIKIPGSYEDFEQQLLQAYHCTNDEVEPLSKEARIVHTLWQAWHSQLDALNIIDEETSYQLKLGESLQQLSNTQFYVAGYYDLLPSEIDWLNAVLNQQQSQLFFNGEYCEHHQHPGSVIHQLLNNLQGTPQIVDEEKTARTIFFDAVFDHSTENLQTRTKQIRANLAHSPIESELSFFRANSAEEEALAIATQIRVWLAEGKTDLALLIEDRKLARRCRAVLEQSGIGLTDLAGWALSTSSTASLIENWLQCIEENWHHLALIDILKSPVISNNDNQFSHAVYRFEQDIIQHENILRDLGRYRAAIKSREHRLNSHHSETAKKIREMLEFIEKAATPLSFIHENNTALLEDYVSALIESLNLLGALPSFENDDAGKEILSLLKQLKSAAQLIPIEMEWIEFRHWFGVKLEEHTFVPKNNFKHHVELLHLSQTVMCQYDALIIGNMTHDHYPGANKNSPFFNQSVRLELGLPAANKQALIRFYHFRRTLESANELLLTYNCGEDETPSSPWLTLISRFHTLSFNSNLENRQLRALIKSIQKKEQIAADANYQQQNPPQIDRSLIPHKISASNHQQLINCPYAFFASAVLKLRAPDEIREKLSKSDYGSRIHLCLQAFHIGDVSGLPGPFTHRLTTENKTNAIALLSNISKRVFHSDLEDNFQHRGWLKRWLSLIPPYIDWEIGREKNWRLYAGEIGSENEITEHLSLKGRIDRVDSDGKEFSIIDYKTGTTPSKADIEHGEAVQLPHYAISYAKKITQIEYLQFEAGTKPVVEKCTLSGEELSTIVEKTESRIRDLFNDIEGGHELPAWGKEQVCSYCRYSGMCRQHLK